MKGFVYLFSALAIGAPALAQSNAGCSDTRVTSCLLKATPSGLHTVGTSTQLECTDQKCLCSALTLQAACFNSYCKEYYNPTSIFGPEFLQACETGGNAGITGSGTIADGMPTATGITEITGSGTIAGPSTAASTSTRATLTTTPSATAATAQVTSTSRAAAQGVVERLPQGGVLALLIGVLANL